MQLENLKEAWKQHKLSNALHYIDSSEVLSIIENQAPSGKSRPHAIFLHVVMVIVITICCQGG